MINDYVSLLKAYNEHTNVYSKGAYDKLDFHIQDCVNIAEMITNETLDVLDMGSGSGLPSVVIAIQNPKNTVVAIESKIKKYTFLDHCKKTLNLRNFHPIQMDINEYLSRHKPSADFITAKAFAPYEKIITICKKIPKRNHHTQLIIPISEIQKDSHVETPPIIEKMVNNTTFFYIKQKIR